MRERRNKPMGFETKDYIGSSEAMRIAKRAGLRPTLTTLLGWIDRNPELGFQPGGHGCVYYIHRKKFRRFVNGQNQKRKQ